MRHRYKRYQSDAALFRYAEGGSEHDLANRIAHLLEAERQAVAEFRPIAKGLRARTADGAEYVSKALGDFANWLRTSEQAAKRSQPIRQYA